MSKSAIRISRKATRQAGEGESPFVRRDVEKHRTQQRRRARQLKRLSQNA